MILFLRWRICNRHSVSKWWTQNRLEIKIKTVFLILFPVSRLIISYSIFLPSFFYFFYSYSIYSSLFFWEFFLLRHVISAFIFFIYFFIFFYFLFSIFYFSFFIFYFLFFIFVFLSAIFYSSTDSICLFCFFLFFW